MSLIRYNGVTLPYNESTEFEITPLREDSGTDWYISKYSLRTQCILTLDLIPILDPSLAQATSLNAAGMLKCVQERLQQPRKEWIFKFGSFDMIPTKPQGVIGTVDAMNGPLPDPCRITQFTNNLFLLEWGITAHYWTNYDINPSGIGANIIRNLTSNAVLYNRWSESVAIDGLNYSRRTRSGMFQVASNNLQGVTVDQLRSQMAVLSIPNGFTRVSSNYAVSPDGLKLKFDIVDEEVFKPAPFPAFKADGSYKQTTTKGNGIVYGEVNVTLEGSKNTNQAVMLQNAISVATAKVAACASDGRSATLKGSGAIILGAGIEVGMWKNIVKCWIKTQFKSNRSLLYGLSGIKRTVTSTPSSDQNPLRVPPFKDRGTAALLLQAATYYDPNLANTMLAQGTIQTSDNPLTSIGRDKVQMSRGRLPGQEGKTL